MRNQLEAAHRIGVIKIQLPSLNDRGEDVLIFAKYFLQMFNGKFKKSLTGISKQALHLLKTYDWKGNVRGMRNMMERVLMAEGHELTLADLGLDDLSSCDDVNDAPPLALKPLTFEGVDLDAMRSYLDEFYFSQAMILAKGNETSAAKMLNLKHHAFRYQYKKIITEKALKSPEAAAQDHQDGKE
jgi:DNA-binding NtrC family response regulator